MDEIEEGDFVTFSHYISEGLYTSRGHGSGYIKSIKDGIALIVFGDNRFTVPVSDCHLLAKQMRLEV